MHHMGFEFQLMHPGVFQHRSIYIQVLQVQENFSRNMRFYEGMLTHTRTPHAILPSYAFVDYCISQRRTQNCDSKRQILLPCLLLWFLLLLLLLSVWLYSEAKSSLAVSFPDFPMETQDSICHLFVISYVSAHSNRAHH